MDKRELIVSILIFFISLTIQAYIIVEEGSEVHPSYRTEITVGDGNTLDNRMPASFYYKNSLTETIYYPAELNSGGMISAVSYESNFISNLHHKAIKLWIGETTLDNFEDGWIPCGQLQQVFDSYLNFPAGQNTIMINFEEPYLYEGGNLVIMMQRPWDETTYNANDRFYTTTTSPYADRTIYNRDNNVEYSPANPPADQFFAVDDFPNTTFYFTTEGIGDVSGFVFDDEEGGPLYNVEIVREGSGIVTYSNHNGSYSFSNVPIGIQSFTASLFGYNSQTLQVEVLENETVNLNFYLVALGVSSVSGMVVGSDFPDTGLENASVTLSGFEDYQTATDADGNFLFPAVYSNQEYQLAITHDDYQPYQSILEVTANTDLGTLVLNEMTTPPGNVHAAQNAQHTEVTISWSMPGVGSEEFRHDDGSADFQIGYNSTPYNAVFGASFLHNAIINEVSWQLTSAYDGHSSVDLYIFGLDFNGIPISSDLLFQIDNVPNNDDEWNSYTLSNPVHAPNGFLVGVGTPNLYTCAALDDGIGNPWIFHENTQWATENWNTNVWLDIGDISPLYQRNLLIRAYGIDFGDLDREDFAQNGSDPEFIPIESDRNFESFNVYRFTEDEHNDPEDWSLIANEIIDTTFIDTEWGGLPIDFYQFAVTSVYTNNVESDPSFSNVIQKTTVAAESAEIDPAGILLLRNFPNPFKKSTMISFNVTRKFTEIFDLTIFNLKGQQVRKFQISNSESGIESIIWNGRDEKDQQVSSGIYFYKLESTDFSKTKKMLLLEN